MPTFDVILTDREAFIDVNYKDADRLDGRSSRNYLNIAAIPLRYLKLIRRLCVASSTHIRKITGRDMVQQSTNASTGRQLGARSIGPCSSTMCRWRRGRARRIAARCQRSSRRFCSICSSGAVLPSLSTWS